MNKSINVYHPLLCNSSLIIWQLPKPERKKSALGWEDSSVGKMRAVQVWGPEFKFSKLCKSGYGGVHLYTPALPQPVKYRHKRLDACGMG